MAISLGVVQTEQHFSQQTNTSVHSRRAQRVQSLSTCVFLSADTLSFPLPSSLSLSLLSYRCLSLPFLPVSLSRWLWLWGGSAGLANRLAANRWRPTAGIFWARKFLRAQTAPANGAFGEMFFPWTLSTLLKKNVNKNTLGMGQYLEISYQFEGKKYNSRGKAIKINK